MNWSSVTKIIPSVISFVGSMIGTRKRPPKRADEILGGANEPTESEKAKAAADAAADAKFGK